MLVETPTVAPRRSRRFSTTRFTPSPHLDLTRPDADELTAMLATLSPPFLGLLGDVGGKDLKNMIAAMRTLGTKDFYVVYSYSDWGKHPVFVLPTSRAKEVVEWFQSGKFHKDTHAEPVGSSVVIGIKDACVRYRTVKPAARPEIAKAFAATGDTTARFVVAPTAAARRCFEELIPTLPKELGGGSSILLTRGVQWFAVGLDGPPKMALHGVVLSSDEATAVKLQEWMSTAAKQLGKTGDSNQIWPPFDPIVAAAKPTRSGDRLVMKLDSELMTALMKPLVGKGQFAGNTKKVQDSLKRIGLAMHYYLDKYKAFPTPASYDKQGKPLLSWRVHLLPFMEQDNLYKQFALDQPWDTPQNLKLIEKMPAVYRHVGGVGEAMGKTPFVVPVGKDTIFPGGKGIGIRDITDGTSNTIMVLEAADASMVTWTRPGRLAVRPQATASRVGGQGATHVLRLVRRWVGAEVYRPRFRRKR